MNRTIILSVLVLLAIALTACGSNVGTYEEETTKSYTLQANIYVEMLDGSTNLVATEPMNLRQIRYNLVNSNGKVLEYGTTCIVVPASRKPYEYKFDGAYLSANQIGKRIEDALQQQGIDFIHTYTTGMSGLAMSISCEDESISFTVKYSYGMAYQPQVIADEVRWHYDPDLEGDQHAWFSIPKDYFDQVMLAAANGQIYSPNQVWSFRGGSLAQFSYFKIPQPEETEVDPDGVKAFVDFYLPIAEKLWGVKSQASVENEVEKTLSWSALKSVSVCCENYGFLHFRRREYTDYVWVNKSLDVILTTGEYFAQP